MVIPALPQLTISFMAVAFEQIVRNKLLMPAESMERK